MTVSSGTSKTGEPYKVGKRTTDFLLEILNLNKTEVLSIAIVSNQEFTEVINVIHLFPCRFYYWVWKSFSISV